MRMKYCESILFALLCASFLIGIASATLIVPPTQVQLEGGNDINGSWKGGFWVFTFALDQADALTGCIAMPRNTTKSYDNGTYIYTKNTVELTLTPQKAYYKRSLKLIDIEDRLVLPAIYYGGLNFWGCAGYDLQRAINPTVVNTYTFAEQGWQKYTVFTAVAKLNGVTIANTSLNTESGTKTLSIATANGSILIKNLGRLEGDYSAPAVPNNIVIFDPRYIYEADALQYIRYDHGRTFKSYASNSYVGWLENSEAFSIYYYGNIRWNPNADIDDAIKATPAPFTKGSIDYNIIDPKMGWESSDYFGGYGRMPSAPHIYPENGSQSLIEYLNMKTSSGNIAKTWLSGYQYHFQYTNGKPTAIIAELPWGAYSGTPVVTCYVPSELADTWVYRPPISNVHILKSGWENTSDVSTNATCFVTLYQNSSLTSSATILAEASAHASITPQSVTVTMSPGETKTLKFSLVNLGVNDDMSGTVAFKVLRTWDAMQTDTSSLTFTLKKPVLPQNVTDVIDRSFDVPDRVALPVPEYSTPWLLITILFCATAVLIASISIIYKTKIVKRQGVQTTLSNAMQLGKSGAKLGLKTSKFLWRSSTAVRCLIGSCLGFFLIWLSLQPVPALLGFFSLGLLSISLTCAALAGFGLFIIAVCIVRLLK